ncbi:hypothetical protein K2173_018273 [Erythroxylum novogranatense]|uniref:F-type ATPase subunit delta n=1 Tax=Erythroxylum novogranatense TaxID=1862640 RepID=A0AAV8U9Z2_9ROSI|nr:hypothetical protein K2173_018273 [Erythroxylum novogranatense]
MAATASNNYATALTEVAKSSNTLQATYADVKKIEKLFSEPQVFDFFGQVIDEIAKSLELQPHTVNFLSILVESKRVEIIKDIVREFEMVYNKLANMELAIHLAQVAKQVQKLTRAKNVRIKTMIDPSLLAAFTVR